MTGREYLDRRMRVTGLFLGISLAAWAVLLAKAEMGKVQPRVMAYPLAGPGLAVLHNLFLIRCPYCRRNLGGLTRSPFDFSLFHFPKRVRFCPRCMTDLEEDAGYRPRRRR